jgi:major vault protein
MAEMRSERDQRDLVLAPNEFAYIQDKTKGEINAHVGPTKATLSGDDIPMKFNADSKKFIEVPVSDIKQTLVTAPAGWYVNLWNPSKTHPRQGTKNTTPEEMIIGKRVVIPGPCSFALWPGQMSEVI